MNFPTTGSRGRLSTVVTALQHTVQVLARTGREGKGMKSIQIGKDEIKPYLQIDTMFYVENQQEFMGKKIPSKTKN